MLEVHHHSFLGDKGEALKKGRLVDARLKALNHALNKRAIL
jgi:hypothetical protein